MPLLYEGADWDYETMRRTYEAIEAVAVGKLGLDTYPNQIEVITAEQMLDAYSSHGLPLMYRHWSFGKRFARDEALYRKGWRGLAYEIVINSNPCINYVMEENSMTMQALVMAHAAFGHNHFFKNNYLFRQWTDADSILDYLSFAKNYVQECEDKHGVAAVERVLDAAHALEAHGVDRYTRKSKRDGDEKRRLDARREHLESTWSALWTTVPGYDAAKALGREEREQIEASAKARLNLPEENVLRFLEKNAPKLRGWERELLRIVRSVSQYFYPQKQTKVMNEGCATFVHYEIMTDLHDRGLVSDGAFMEFLHSHTSVVFQPTHDDQRFSGWNPYALGFAMMCDIKRICLDPTDEDRRWFPGFAGNGDPYGTLRHAWANYRDESFILQYLSPKVMRDFRMFHVADVPDDPYLKVADIHDDEGFRRLRARLAQAHDLSRHEPDINVVDLDLLGDRTLVLAHAVHDGRGLDRKSAFGVLHHLRELWGYKVVMLERDAKTGMEIDRFESL